MHRRWLAVCFVVLCGCSFRSGLEIQVQVYNGEDIVPIEYVPDLRGALTASGRIRTQSDLVGSDLDRASEEGRQILNAMSSVIVGSAELFADLTNDEEYQARAAAVLRQAMVAAMAINERITDTALSDPRRIELSAAILTLRTDEGDNWRGNAFDDESIQVNDVDLTEWPTSTIAEAVKNERLWVDPLIRLLRENDRTRWPELATDLAEIVMGQFSELLELEAEEVSWAVSVDRVIEEERGFLDFYQGAFERLDSDIAIHVMPRRERVFDAVAAFETAVQQTMGGQCSAEDGSREISQVGCADPLVELGALIATVNELARAVAALQPSPMELFSEAVDSVNEVLAVAHADYLRSAGLDRVDLPDATSIDVSSAVSRLRELSQTVNQAFVTMADSRQEVANLVAEIRARPFVGADPNIGIVTEAGQEEFWNNTVDSIVLSGTGEAQYVVVQDGPTTYRPKELHLDPEGVIGLQVSMAEAGLDILTKVAAISSGQPWLTVDERAGEIGTGGGIIETAQSDQETSERISDEFGSLRRQAEMLQVALEALDDDVVNLEHVAALRGLLTRARVRLEGIKSAALSNSDGVDLVDGSDGAEGNDGDASVGSETGDEGSDNG